jgi:hypothetical protein
MNRLLRMGDAAKSGGRAPTIWSGSSGRPVGEDTCDCEWRHLVGEAPGDTKCKVAGMARRASAAPGVAEWRPWINPGKGTNRKTTTEDCQLIRDRLSRDPTMRNQEVTAPDICRYCRTNGLGWATGNRPADVPADGAANAQSLGVVMATSAQEEEARCEPGGSTCHSTENPGARAQVGWRDRVSGDERAFLLYPHGLRTGCARAAHGLRTGCARGREGDGKGCGLRWEETRSSRTP